MIDIYLVGPSGRYQSTSQCRRSHCMDKYTLESAPSGVFIPISSDFCLWICIIFREVIAIQLGVRALTIKFSFSRAKQIVGAFVHALINRGLIDPGSFMFLMRHSYSTSISGQVAFRFVSTCQVGFTLCNKIWPDADVTLTILPCFLQSMARKPRGPLHTPCVDIKYSLHTWWESPTGIADKAVNGLEMPSTLNNFQMLLFGIIQFYIEFQCDKAIFPGLIFIESRDTDCSLFSNDLAARIKNVSSYSQSLQQYE